MGYYIFLFIIPLFVWLGIAKILFKHEFSLKEILIQAGVTGFILILLVATGSRYQTIDYKIVNGVVTKLDPRTQSCPAGWVSVQDNFCTEYRTRTVKVGESCSTDTNGRRTCTPRYDTEYNYIYDWERRYFVRTDIDETFEISRVDRQGVSTPQRFSSIKIGDPVSISVAYTNYIKGAVNTLLNQKYEEVPQISYPQIYDYYRVNRVIYFDAQGNSDYVKEWNEELSVLNSSIRKTNANVIINVVGSTLDWSERLAQAWDAHNINDVVVSIGTDGEKIDWVDVRSWSKNNIVNIEIRDEIMSLKNIDKTRINDIIKTSIEKNYVQQDMKDFEYLADDIPPPTWVFVIAGIILLVATPIVTLYFSKPENRF